MEITYCKCGCGQEVVEGNVYVHGHNRRGLPSHITPDGKWSRKYDKCIECGTIEIPYGGKGLCTRCYKRHLYKNAETKTRWSLKYECCIDCGRTDRLHSAHGRCVVCVCNHKAHMKGIQKRNFGAWSWYYDKCVKCGTTERPHVFDGLCRDCYEESKRVGKVLKKCPVCGINVEKLSQHLTMRAKKCEKHLKYLYETYKIYFDSDLGLKVIAKELNVNNYTVTKIFRRLFGVEETKQRNATVKSLLCSSRAKIGFNHNNRFGTVTYYDSLNNGKVRFRSRLECSYATYLDNSEIKWEYERDSFPYLDIKGKRRTYTPDFYLIDTDEYIEIKGYDNGEANYKIDKMREIGLTIKILRKGEF